MHHCCLSTVYYLIFWCHFKIYACLDFLASREPSSPNRDLLPQEKVDICLLGCSQDYTQQLLNQFP